MKAVSSEALLSKNNLVGVDGLSTCSSRVCTKTCRTSLHEVVAKVEQRREKGGAGVCSEDKLGLREGKEYCVDILKVFCVVGGDSYANDFV